MRQPGRDILSSVRREPLARRILLVDADAFFVAVARLVDPTAPEGAAPHRRRRCGSRGVVCSASYETRHFGVLGDADLRASADPDSAPNVQMCVSPCSLSVGELGPFSTVLSAAAPASQ